MSSYHAFEQFMIRLINRLGLDVDAVLDELRQEDPVAWMEFQEHLRSITEPPAIGTLGHQSTAARAMQDYLSNETKRLIPTFVGRVVVEAHTHYRHHGPELEALIAKYTLRGVRTADLIQELLEPPDHP